MTVQNSAKGLEATGESILKNKTDINAAVG